MNWSSSSSVPRVRRLATPEALISILLKGPCTNPVPSLAHDRLSNNPWIARIQTFIAHDFPTSSKLLLHTELLQCTGSINPYFSLLYINFVASVFVTMTLPLACPPPSSCASSDPPTVPQRKRRRRAPASGATDDCFTCTKRNIKCDRRRPYCSQCLEIGNECSGYKTQLTWGVGVASRGKLRGLSLPVARSAPAAKSPPPTTARQRALSTTSNHRFDDVKIKKEQLSSSVYTTYDFVNMAPHGVANPPLHSIPDWSMATAEDNYPVHDYHHQTGMSHQRQLPQLHRLHTLSLDRGSGMGLSSSLDSMSAYTESDYNSPVSHSFPNDDVPFLHSPVPMYNNYSSRNSVVESPVAGMMGDSRGPTSCPDPFYPQSEMSSSISSHQNLYDIAEAEVRQQHSPAHNDIFYDDDMLG